MSENTINIFEQASRMRLRFSSVIGEVSAEELWTLPLKSKEDRICLDFMARNVARQLRNAEEESFVSSKSSVDKEATLRLDILKHIIKVRLEESEVEVARLAASKMKAKILEIIDKKEDSVLMGQSVDDLKKMVTEL